MEFADTGRCPYLHIFSLWYSVAYIETFVAIFLPSDAHMSALVNLGRASERFISRNSPNGEHE